MRREEVIKRYPLLSTIYIKSTDGRKYFGIVTQIVPMPDADVTGNYGLIIQWADKTVSKEPLPPHEVIRSETTKQASIEPGIYYDDLGVPVRVIVDPDAPQRRAGDNAPEGLPPQGPRFGVAEPAKYISTSQAIRDLLDLGKSRQDIARVLGVTYRYVYGVERARKLREQKQRGD